jgi:hypothetical protein
VLLLGGLVGLCLLVSNSAAGPRLVPIQIENALPGSSGWRVPIAPRHGIEGYASDVSLAAGDSLDIHVSTAPAADYRVELYRLGWYGGIGGRLVACLPSCTASEPGQAQPVPLPDPGTGFLDAGWTITDAIRVPASWVSGYYVAVLRLTSGPAAGKGSWVPFVVRAPPAQHSAILVQAAVNTWQAYNRWGGMSLYKDASGGSCKGICTHVSFNRPYDPATQGFSNFELPLVHFLEESGYDVSYSTDVDTDRDPAELLRHRLVVVAGHDEYWTKRMRDGFETARTLGTNLAFMGANTGYWQMRYASQRRTIVEYRTRRLDPEPNPARKTVRFRDLVPPRPECELEGVEYVRAGVESIGGQHDFGVAPGALPDPWFSGTGFTASSLLPGLVGYEWDAVAPGCKTPLLTVLFHYGGAPAPADAVRYTAPSGAIVFSAGSLSFAKGLDDFQERPGVRTTGDQRAERFVRNAFADLLRPAAPSSVRTSAGPAGVTISVQRAPDPRVREVRIYRARANQPLARGSRGLHFVCGTLTPSCVDRSVPRGRRVRYVVVVRDSWGASIPLVTAPVVARPGG